MIERRKRGRPPKAAGGNAALTWLTDAEYDVLITIARVNRCSVSEVIARVIRISLIEKSKTQRVA